MNSPKRRVKIRRAEPGAFDAIKEAYDRGVEEGRALRKADYMKAEAHAIARAKADERVVSQRMYARMEKDIEALVEERDALRKQLTEGGPAKAKVNKDWRRSDKTWIASFEEENPDAPDYLFVDEDVEEDRVSAAYRRRRSTSR